MLSPFFPTPWSFARLAILYCSLASPQQLIAYLNSISNCVLMSNLINNTNICTSVKMYTFTYHPLRLQQALIFQLSSGSLHQTRIYKHRRITKYIKNLSTVLNCRYQNICISTNSTHFMISTTF
jgi:hypothetical protein